MEVDDGSEAEATEADASEAEATEADASEADATEDEAKRSEASEEEEEEWRLVAVGGGREEKDGGRVKCRGTSDEIDSEEEDCTKMEEIDGAALLVSNATLREEEERDDRAMFSAEMEKSGEIAARENSVFDKEGASVEEISAEREVCCQSSCSSSSCLCFFLDFDECFSFLSFCGCCCCCCCCWNCSNKLATATETFSSKLCLV